MTSSEGLFKRWREGVTSPSKKKSKEYMTYEAQQLDLIDGFEDADRLTRGMHYANPSKSALASLTSESVEDGGDGSDDLKRTLSYARAMGSHFLEDIEADTNPDDKKLVLQEKRDMDGIAANLSLGANICLLGIKVAVLISSGSLAVLASVIDSLLDLFCAATIWATTRFMSKRDRYKYPAGKGRFEPIATIIIASVMSTAAIELVSRAIQDIVNGVSLLEVKDIDYALLGLTVIVKVALWIFCSKLGSSASTAALATDHANDSWSNSITIGTSLVAQNYWAPADPAGAMLIAAIIMRNWYKEGKEHVLNLGGRVANDRILKRLTWVAMNHDSRVLLVDTVRAMHMGANVHVEIDIVLPPEMPLHEAHDIGEGLQHKLERLPEVDRAHVHLDYEIDHGADDEHKRL